MTFEEEQKRLEQAAGPHGPRTTELVGVDDIGLPSGILPDDMQDPADAPPDRAPAGGHQPGHPPSPVTVSTSGPDLAPGDEAAPGTVGSGDDVCPVCGGSGKAASGGGDCPHCRGTGIVTEGIGGG